jgi:hypothetical protein
VKFFALSIFLTGISFASYAQLSFAIINDKDGFVNIRKDKNATSAVIGKIYNDDIFGYDPDDKSDWVEIYQQISPANVVHGYIHKSRVFPLAYFKTIKNIKVLKDSCVATNDSLVIRVKSQIFNPKEHRLTYDRTNKNFPTLEKIDDKHIWGTDGALPTKVISSLSFIKNGVNLTIPKDAYNDLYQPTLSTLKVYLGKGNTAYIELNNSDGAGAYTVIWIVKNERYLKRYINFDD